MYLESDVTDATNIDPESSQNDYDSSNHSTSTVAYSQLAEATTMTGLIKNTMSCQERKVLL